MRNLAYVFTLLMMLLFFAMIEAGIKMRDQNADLFELNNKLEEVNEVVR